MDLCAYSETLNQISRKYTFTIMINASVRGPFIHGTRWIQYLISLLTDQAKLVGLSINCVSDQATWIPPNLKSYALNLAKKYPLTHVQSMVLVTDETGLNIIKPHLICVDNKIATVAQGEIRISVEILTSGFNLREIIPGSETIDWRNESQANSICDLKGGDIWYPPGVHPFESIFFKTNRGINTLVLDRLTKWSLN